MKVLVTGFGPFRDVVDNPSGRLAEAVDGSRRAGLEVIGRVLPVSFARGPAAAIALAREHGVDAVVGLGVAVRRSAVDIECQAHRRTDGVDMDGVEAPALSGPECVGSTWSPQSWAEALSCTISEDAGSYVCNAWLYQVALALDCPVVFIHIPPAGLSPERFLKGLEWMAAIGVDSSTTG